MKILENMINGRKAGLKKLVGENPVSEKDLLTIKKKIPVIPFLMFSRKSHANRCSLEVVETAEQYKALLRLRKEIFMYREGYPYEALTNGYERESVHIMARAGKKYVGMVSVKLNDARGLPINK